MIAFDTVNVLIVGAFILTDERRCFIAFQTQLICLKHNYALWGELAVTISDCTNPYLIMKFIVCTCYYAFLMGHVKRKPEFCMYAIKNHMSTDVHINPAFT